MELFLNILWVVIAAAALCVWRTRWTHEPRDREHEPWRQWTTLVCALVLLFFIVSLTDDLHSELVIFEECSAGRRHATCMACPHHTPQIHAAKNIYAAGPKVSGFEDSLVLSGSVIADGEHSRTFFQSGPTSGRAPPVVFR
jgi:hypothetical protein